METPSTAADPDLRVRDFMTAPAVTTLETASVADAFEVMLERDIRHLPVQDEKGALVGILSDRALFLAKRERGIRPEDVSVAEMMSREPFSVSPDTPLREAARVMAHRRYGCSVVVAGGRVVGILTTTDALRALASLRLGNAQVPAKTTSS
jgi:acetoin utilization protein AcuB